MKWRKKKYKPGEIRFHSCFLWWPLNIDEETRWLEFVTIEQKRSPSDICWFDIRFVDKKDKLEEL